MTRQHDSAVARSKVLVVDDSSASRRQLRRALEGAGFAVSEAAEGVEALWRARHEVFDLVLTDIHMPTMDGLQFLAGLRRLQGYERVPVYVLSSDCSQERIAEGRRLGATAWVVKPADLPQLMGAVREAVAARGA